jgi:ABC-type glycerol-3-phosphate transport system substrate-binding protein
MGGISDMRNIMYKLLAVIVFGAMLTSCAKQTATEKKTIITFWDGTFNEENFKPVLEIWNERYPNITIEPEFYIDNGMLEKYILASQNGNAGDVIMVQIDWAYTLATAGLLEPLDPYIQKDNIDLSKYAPGAIRAGTVNGKRYAIPYRTESWGIFYNKDVFAKAGLSEPPKTWNQVLEYGRIIQEKLPGVYGFGITGKPWSNVSFNFTTILRCHGGDLLTEDLKKSALDTPIAFQAMEFYNSLREIAPKSFNENESTDNRNLFAIGQLGMYLYHVSDLIELRKTNPDCNYGVALMPTIDGSDEKRNTMLGGWNVVIPEKGKKKDMAWEFVKFITSPEISALYSRTYTGDMQPAKNNAEAGYDPEVIRVLGETLKWANPWPTVQNIGAIRQAVVNHLQEVTTDAKTPEQGMREAAAEINSLLNG